MVDIGPEQEIQDYREVPRKVSETFQTPIKTVENEDSFNERDMGLNHPDNGSFIKMCQNGDIEIVADASLAIVLSPESQSITFIADHVKFMTKHSDGLRWNNLSFNDKANNYNEPTFIDFEDDMEGYDLYQGVDYYIDGEEVDPYSGVSVDLINDAIRNIGDKE